MSEFEESIDPRIARSRAALLEAAIAIVAERESTEVSVVELAARAGLSRQVLYERFGDRDGLIAAATDHLIRSGLLPQLPVDLESPEAILTVARHLAAHRAFYRAVLTGHGALAAQRSIIELFLPFSVEVAEIQFDVTGAAAAELARYLTGATVMALSRWVVEGPSDPDPDVLAGELLRVMDTLARPRRRPGRGKSDAR